MKKIIKCDIQGDTFKKLSLAFRCITFGGRYGGGKTLGAVALAYWMKASGYVDKIVSNIPMEYTDDDKQYVYRSVIILDEAWQYITSRRSVLQYSAYLRKIDSYLILPSVFDIHYRLNFFQNERVINFQNIGLPAWYYKWYLTKGRTRDKGTFWITNPQVLYGLYDNLYVPFDDEEISERLKNTILDVGKRQENGNKLLSRALDKLQNGNSSFLADGGVSVDALSTRYDDLEDEIMGSYKEIDIQLQERIDQFKKIRTR